MLLPTSAMPRCCTSSAFALLAAVVAAALVHAPACAQTPEPPAPASSTPAPGASAPATPPTATLRRLQGQGFSVIAPAADWRDFPAGVPGAITLGKVDAIRAKAFRAGGSVVFGAVAIPMRGHDLSTPDGMREAIRAFVNESNRRFTLVSSSLEPLAEPDLGTDCLRVETLSEERNNRSQPGQVLLLSTFGKMCRHPGAGHTLVQVTCSERRVAGTPPVVDDAVRRECEAAVASLRFDASR